MSVFFFLYLLLSFYFLAVQVFKVSMALSSCGDGRLPFVWVCGLSLRRGFFCGSSSQALGLGSCGMQALERRLSGCGTGVYLLRGI